jgi:hypothetical protein
MTSLLGRAAFEHLANASYKQEKETILELQIFRTNYKVCPSVKGVHQES